MGFLEELFDLNRDGQIDALEEYIMYKTVMGDDEENDEDEEKED